MVRIEVGVGVGKLGFERPWPLASVSASEVVPCRDSAVVIVVVTHIRAGPASFELVRACTH